MSVLDTACARLALGQNATPPAVEDCRAQIDDLDVQERVLEREAAAGADHAERLAAIAAQRDRGRGQARRARRSAGRRKRELVDTHPRAARAARRAPSSAAARRGTGEAAAPQPALDPDALRAELAALNAELDALQGETPLMRVCVDAQIVGEVISGWTGIPVGKMLQGRDPDRPQARRAPGQARHRPGPRARGDRQRIRTSQASLDDPDKPIGVFLLVGPSGVGKTETALALADLLYGGERNLITINMSEFQEAHTVSTLKGSPPGYVGYGEGGVLTEAVRRRPYSVVLLDEVEKAHPDVLELFFQVFDKGRMEDGEGREIDFKNTIIILTSNAGTDTMMKLRADPGDHAQPGRRWSRRSSRS